MPTTSMLTAADGTGLALHRWTTPGATSAVFYIHGIQSHAGWLYETGPELNARGIDVYALDRRGSGRSEGPRGHLPSADLVLDDYARALDAVTAKVGGAGPVALGQSLGGSVLAALWCSRDLPVRRLVLCAPALGQQRARHTADTLAERRALTGGALRPVGLADDDYTDLPRYREFLAADPLMLREVTSATQATLVHLEDHYAGGAPRTRLPVDLALPTHDPIIDLSAARAMLQRLTSAVHEEIFATDRHYVEFTSARTAYWDWLATRLKEEA
ncbi:MULTISPECIES: alpha/beta fold hydrolase [unclassified Streptomyces]|uniref:alpha/beta fold hydrolase n=1 Tax=unclassified Streptomyces TaxID=2593676 RepID=UPI00073B0A04|nr:alpha/beta fold hydrolase [Streptomyces sp. AVP053U2]ODA74780.1 Alpha/beta hydrolase family protein [Streptomyces sp. AVP053U2]